MKRRFKQRLAFILLQLLGEFYNQDRILRSQTNDGNNRDLEVNVIRQVWIFQYDHAKER
ncbi:hypothetical protein SDC9_173740 [bioreactor metagenome]|uniref:Uncharacterized protein n=1 Tax=bioreactor metagenome TaxID=1076179 RepID=A0A645GJA1_9ZZZZ